MTEKCCRECGEVKPASEFYAHYAECKICCKTRARAYYLAHRDEISARQRARRAEKNTAYTAKQAERFWSHVDQSKGVDACWPWMLGVNADGYGSVTISGQFHNASRVAWIIANGDPGDLKVLHTCDNRICCNPDHLFLGTNKDNSVDMVQKGRSTPGEKNGHHKLTENEVAQIRKLFAQGNITKRELGRRFNTHHRNITFIVRMETWK